MTDPTHGPKAAPAPAENAGAPWTLYECPHGPTLSALARFNRRGKVTAIQLCYGFHDTVADPPEFTRTSPDLEVPLDVVEALGGFARHLRRRNGEG